MSPEDWLGEEMTVAAAEARNPGPAGKLVPFGFMNAGWERLKAQMRPGDALWSFASPRESWAHLAGRAG
jgi:hypothetical protein